MAAVQSLAGTQTRSCQWAEVGYQTVQIQSAEAATLGMMVGIPFVEVAMVLGTLFVVAALV